MGSVVLGARFYNEVEDAIRVEIEVTNQIEHTLPGKRDVVGITQVDQQEGDFGVALVVLPQQGVFALLVVDLGVDSRHTSLGSCALH
jgi:hypothetical protein